MSLQIKFFSVGCGDAIAIRFLGNDEKYHNILIDGGIENKTIYTDGIKKEILSIVDRGEIIDLWIISHIDDDHIGGVLCFVKEIANDSNFRNQVDLSKTQFWFNYANKDYDTGIRNNDFRGVEQGMRLRDFLANNAKLGANLTNKNGEVNFLGIKLNLLSPDKKKYDRLLRAWEDQEIEIIEKEANERDIESKANDYSKKIGDFNLSKFKEDGAVPNGSSIAFLLEFEGRKVLFLADSHPSVIASSLKALGYSKQNKLKLDAMQLSHHGSKGNTSIALLEIIDTDTFIISADAYNKHELPNKETMARVIHSFPDKNIQFLITHKNDLTKSIFEVDTNLENVKCGFPSAGSNAIILDF